MPVVSFLVVLFFRAESPSYKAKPARDFELSPETNAPRSVRPAPQTKAPDPYTPRTVDAIVRSLSWGSVALSAREKLEIREEDIVTALLSPEKTEAELTAELKRRSSEASRIESATIRISNRMRADLAGSGFDIHPRTPNVQAVGSGTTRWAWAVVPTKSGEQSLELTVSALIDVAGKDTPIVVQTYEKKIFVEISTTQHARDFLSKNWQWLWATVLVPVAALIWKRWKPSARSGPSISERLRQIRDSRRNR